MIRQRIGRFMMIPLVMNTVCSVITLGVLYLIQKGLRAVFAIYGFVVGMSLCVAVLCVSLLIGWIVDNSRRH